MRSRRITAIVIRASTSGATTRLPSVTSNSRSQIQLGFEPQVSARSAWASSAFTPSKVPIASMSNRGCTPSRCRVGEQSGRYPAETAVAD